MRSLRLAAALLAASTLLGLPYAAGAQTAGAPQSAPQSAPLAGKTIGKPQQPQLVPSMIVLTARGAKLAGQTLTLEGISPSAIVFADRPIRSAGHALTKHLLEEWSSSAPDSFAKDPPNATVSVLNKGKGEVVDAVMVLKSPKLEGDKLVFNVEVIEGNLAGGDGAVSVFLDIINLPLARRTSHRSAWYAGAQ
jgi:hypothetical protein